MRLLGNVRFWPQLTIGDRPAMSACQGEAVVTSALAEVRK
jgi:hypothetical protein